MPVYILFALVAALGYSLSSLFNKRALEEGCSPWHVPTLIAWTTAIVFVPLLFIGPAWPSPALLYQPLLAALCWYSGAFFHTLALKSGDVSIVGPVMGTKPMVNALLVTILLRQALPPSVWIACGLVVVALVVMHSPNVTTRNSFITTVLLTFCAACLFALCDTVFQHYAHHWGAARFTVLSSQLAAIGCLVFIPHFRKRLGALSPVCRAHLLTGVLFFLLPAFCMGYAVGRYGHAPEINVVYSSRALWSIVMVWSLGRVIGSREHKASRHVLLRRLAGAMILMAALMLVIFGEK